MSQRRLHPPFPRRALPAALAVVVLLGPGCPAPQDAGPSEQVVRHNSLGTAYLGQQKWADAEAEFRQAVALAPDEALPLNNIAVALVQVGEIDRAEASLRSALELDPDNPYAHYNLGLLFKNQGEFESAAVHFETVAAIDPGDLLTQYNLGIVLSRLGRDDEARQAFERALEQDPAHVSTLYGLGQFLLRRGEEEEGRRLVARSAEIRARSGLDSAVGSQYGELGPYALGADYPGGTLPAPDPVAVRFGDAARTDLSSPVVAWTLAPVPGEEAPALLVAAGNTLHRLGSGSAVEPLATSGPGPVLALAAADVDGDGVVDLAAILERDGRSALTLLQFDDEGWLVWLDEPGQITGNLDTAAAERVDLTALDRDHDGDLDLFWCLNDDAGRTSCAVATNDGVGNFTIRDSIDHGFAPSGGAAGPVRVGFSDYDNEPGGVHVYSNQRDDTFEDVSAKAGLGDTAGTLSMAIADLDKDGWMDLLLGGPRGVELWRNERGRFAAAGSVGPSGSADAVLVLDYDNDGFLDVVRSDPATSPGAVRNRGAGKWSEQAKLLQAAGAGALPLAAFDADSDGDLDLAFAGPGRGVALLTNEGGNAHNWITVWSAGMSDNRLGIGSKVEVLAGALRQKVEVTGPVPLHFGIGERDRVESVRYLWPGGVLQDEIDLPAGETVEVTQLDRKGTSCPLLYAWGTEGWRFLTDFLGGSAVNNQLARGVFGTPDTDEYIKIEGGIVEDGEGRLRLRMNNQLEEVIWFDQVELVVVDHPAGSEVFPNERLMPGPPWPEFELFASSDVRPVAAARDVESGRDLSDDLAAADSRFAEHFDLLPFKGYATPHTLELDLGAFAPKQRVVLLLDGWIDYADSSSNIAAEQAGLKALPPRLTVADGNGGWRATGHRMGFPAGLPKTMAVELTGLFSAQDHRLRIETNLRIHWDRARVLLGGERTPLQVQRLPLRAAELRFGGFPRPTGTDGPTPLGYDPRDVLPVSNWKAHVGAYTAFGDVSPLLESIDDRLVTTRSGDEIELSFAAPPPVAAGRQRTYLLYANGFGKDMDPNSSANNEVGPMPFHGMPSYPYPDDVVPPVTVDGTGSRRVLPSEHGWPGARPQRLAGRVAE